MYSVPVNELRALSQNPLPLSFTDAENILNEATERPLSLAEISRFIATIGTSDFDKIRKKIIDVSSQIRHRNYGNTLVTMAPVEVTNRCASNCNFCGWRADNKKMERLSINDDIVSIQVQYLLEKGIEHIELVGGDDIKFVRYTLPRLIPKLKRQLTSVKNGKLLFCTMALTESHYRMLSESGADGMIMWQETYDETLYRQHVVSGPKAFGIDDDFQIIKGGNGFNFRLQSQDRAAQAGLILSVGSMIGLNKNVAFEVLATIHHARYLCDVYHPHHPVIVGMPTWNKITTKETDNRPENILEMDGYFSFFSALYLLALSDLNVWIFPNCRVSMASQVEAVKAAGAYTSTEVKVGPGGYLAEIFHRGDAATRESILEKLHTCVSGKAQTPQEILKRLDDMEQFQHHYHLHEDYVLALADVGITVSGND